MSTVFEALYMISSSQNLFVGGVVIISDEETKTEGQGVGSTASWLALRTLKRASQAVRQRQSQDERVGVASL